MTLDLSNYKGQNPFMPVGPTAQTPTSPFPAPAGTYGPPAPVKLDFSGLSSPFSSPSLTAVPGPTPAPAVTKSAMAVAPTIAPSYSLPNADGSFSGGTNNLPPQGSDAFNAAVKAKNFSLYSDTNTYPSSTINTGTTRSDVMNYRSGMHNDMMSGANPSLIPSDSNLKDVAAGVYQNSQYTPEEITLMNSIADNKSKITETSLAERRKIQQLLEDGSISPAQAKAFGQEEARRYDANIADLTASQTGDTNRLAVLAALRGNNLEAYKNLASFFKPQEIAPGSTAIDQFGNTVAGGTGVAPATAATYASQLFNDDLKTGSQHLTPDGQVDTQFYYQRAQQILGGQASGGTGTPMASPTSTPGFTGNAGLPATLQPYVVQGTGGNYINEDKVPTGQRDFVKQQAAQNGVAYLTGDDIAKYRNIEVTQSNLDSLQQVVQKVNGSGLAGRTFGALWNVGQSFLQTNKDISSYNVWRDTAINTIQALAGGSGSGLRLNQAEIDTATGNLPKITDNLETATTKLNLVRGFLGKWQAELLHGNVNGPKAVAGQTVQTQAGPVSTNW